MYTFNNINKKKKISITGYSKQKDESLSKYAEKINCEQLGFISAPIEGEKFKFTPKEGSLFIDFIKDTPLASIIEKELDSIAYITNRNNGNESNLITSIIDINLLKTYLMKLNEDYVQKKHRHIVFKLKNHILNWTAEEIDITGYLF